MNRTTLLLLLPCAGLGLLVGVIGMAWWVALLLGGITGAVVTLALDWHRLNDD